MRLLRRRLRLLRHRRLLQLRLLHQRQLLQLQLRPLLLLQLLLQRRNSHHRRGPLLCRRPQAVVRDWCG